MANKTISDLNEVINVESDSYLVVESSNETNKITTNNFMQNLAKKNDLNEYAKKSEIPTKVSELTNNSKYITETEVGTAISSYVEEHKKELKGDKGEPGNTPENPNFTIGTVTKLEAGADPTVTITGNYPNFVLNFGIPVGSGSDTPPAAKEYIYWGRLGITEVGNGESVIQYNEITADMILNGKNINTIEPTTMEMTSFGLASTTADGDHLVVAVPASSNYIVTKDNGLRKGIKVRFSEESSGANGNVTLNISGVDYRLYGEVLMDPGELFFYVDTN